MNKPNQEQLLSRINESGSQLLDVIGFYDRMESQQVPEELAAICLVFESEKILIVVDDEDDSLSISTNTKSIEIGEYVRKSLQNSPHWQKAINKPLLWSWIMINQQGYFDGLQLEFAFNSETPSVVVQLVAIASTIKHRKVSSILV